VTSTSFNLLGDLPSGTTNISASAGTGKTFTLAALTTRFVAEAEVAIGEILVVTFTRSAAAELKDRIRRRLVEAEAALRPGAPESTDELLVHLRREDREARHRRLRAAVSEFDAATITTIHGFAQQALGTLGVSAPADPDASLVEDSEELIKAISADVLTRRALADDISISLKGLVAMASKVLSLPDVAVIPNGDSGDPGAEEWAETVSEVVARVSEARRAAGVMAYDDILTQLRDAVVGGGRIANAMSDRFPVALIDEFQDTDPVQWDIFSTLFSRSALVLVGDPKQAIYAFRGADLHTYLAATSGSDVLRSTLDENWRSDDVLLRALNAIMVDTTFGDAQIVYVPVVAAPPNSETRIQNTDGVALVPLVFRNGPVGTDGKALNAGPARAAIASDLAQRVRNLLETATLPADATRRAVNPGDIAVLVRSHSETPGIQLALAEHGIPSVMSKVGSVFTAPAASQLRRLLAGIARPAAPRRVRAVALGWFGSVDAAGLENLQPDDQVALAETLHMWAEVLANEGVDEFAAKVWAESGVAERVLHMPDGDRHLTDLEHLIEVLSTSSAGSESLSVNGLLERFDVLAGGASDDDVGSELLERRIESDATAVQIMTVHGSKGLEWPIVCCPSLGRGVSPVRATDVVFHDADLGGRVIDVGASANWPGDKERRNKARQETAAESMRLAYVALTRAQHQVIVWRHPFSRKTVTPLSQILFGVQSQAPGIDEFDTLMANRAASVSDLVEISRVQSSPAEVNSRWSPPEALESGELQVAQLARELPRTARRWSFTAISSQAAEHQTGHLNVDPEDITGGDSGGDDEYSNDDAPVELFVPPVTDLCWGEVPGSAAFGTMVHSAFEEVDFAAKNLRSEVARVVAELGKWNEWPAEQSLIVEGLVQAITTPLGSGFGGISLQQVVHADRLDEMVFDFGLGNAGVSTGRQIGELIFKYLGEKHQLSSWASKVALGEFGVQLDGHLTGSIDLVLRLHGPERYMVLDYKTNSLSEPGMPLMSSDYHPDRLADAMAHHHYPLQALLYSVALHRYLRWRLPNYSPEQHLGGAGYLFVRGMAGSDTPAPGGRTHGVFDWQIAPQLVTSLSDLLDGRAQ
jgi:exodeoxyribonuclease V beta subunit